MNEDRLRRMARQQGLRLQKARTRDWRNPAYGTYRLVDENNIIVAYNPANGYGLSLEDVADALAEEVKAAVAIAKMTAAAAIFSEAVR